jgi:hypothetical protein
MRRPAVLAGATMAALAALVVAWRRNPRMGTTFTNGVVNTYLVQRGLSGSGRSELGTLEHVGRASGIRRLTPIHPVATADGFRIMVPLGTQSEWARNVIGAGHCRMQLHDRVYELDEPVLLAPDELPDIPAPVAAVLDRLGFEYLLLRTFADRPGHLEATGAIAGEPVPKPEAVLAGAS